MAVTEPEDEALLELTDYGISFSERQILQGLSLRIAPTGMNVLMGPAGTGKSTLLRTLAGLNNASPSLRLHGSATYQGEPIGTRELPAIVTQKTRLMMATVRENLVNDLPERNTLQLRQQRDIATRLLQEAGLGELADQLDRKVVDLPIGQQRLLAVVRTAAANPRLLLVDEPTWGVDDDDAQKLIAFLKAQAAKRAVVVVVHNQQHARSLGGKTILLAGGAIVETRQTQDFFDTPECSLARDFVRTGSCPDESIPQRPDAKPVRSEVFGPRNFLWLVKGQIAGTPRPGLFHDVAVDLEALSRVGVTTLVSLEKEFPPTPAEELARFDIQGLALPIPDMGVPGLQEAAALCQELDTRIAGGEVVALHCRAGLGRTGTLLAAFLIFRGRTALDALGSARNIEPRWVQSESQVAFLEQFEAYAKKNFPVQPGECPDAIPAAGNAMKEGVEK